MHINDAEKCFSGKITSPVESQNILYIMNNFLYHD